MNLKPILLVAVVFITACAHGQNGQVKRGPRQLVNVDALSDSAFYPGKINIKFKEGFDTLLKASVGKSANGNIRFGIIPVDALIRNLGITSARLSFNNILQTNNNSARHKAWAFQRWYSIQLPKKVSVKAAIKQFKALSAFIETAEPSYVRTLYEGSDPGLIWAVGDSAYNKQWHYNHTAQEGATSPEGTDADIDLPEAWQLETGKPNVIVAVMDGGVDTSHPDLRQNLWIGSNGERFGYNWYANSNLLQASSHATHVCGTIGAVNNNGIGVSGIAGGDGTAGSGVRIMSMQIFSSSSVYAGDEATANAFVYSADHGAAISQNSWGGGAFSVLVTDAIDYFIMNGGGKVLNGGLVVSSAGNAGNDVENFPGNYPPVISVAATNYDDKKSSYSSYGSWVDIAAPGGETSISIRKGILSTLPVTNIPNYGWLQGTSMACPHVSGVAALCVSKAQGKLSNEQLRNILLSTTDDIYPLNPSYTGKLGTGRLNAFKAVHAAALAIGNLVDSVSVFSINQSCGQASLQWTKNNAGNQVIIATSDTLLFGTPSGTMKVGDVLPGGGNIIYTGPGATFNTPLPVNQRRYFRIWSFSGTSYSFHKTSSILYSSFVGPLIITDQIGCTINLNWADSLSCVSDSVLLIAHNKTLFTTPSGNLQVGDTISGGAKVIYKGRGKSYVYTTDLDSNVYIQKWNFDGSHHYTNANANTNEFANKQNAIKSMNASGVSSATIQIGWQNNVTEQCFGGNTYLLAYSTDGIFGEPTGVYSIGSIVKGGGTVLYIGNNTSFLHQALIENNPYCYKVWKVKNQSTYSSGKSFCTRTLCGDNIIIPAFADGFDGLNLYDPDNCHWGVADSSSRDNALKIVSSGVSPDILPVQGTGMIRFNSYNIPADKTLRLSSSLIKKGVGKDVDLLFRWYQDSSNYVSSGYAGEGVLVQWSTDRINWQSLEFYPRIPVQGLSGWSYKQITLPSAASLADSVYVSFLFTSKFGNNCYLDDLKIKYSSFKSSNGVTRVAACESTDSTSQWTNYYDSTGDRLLSIKKNAQDIGKAGQPGFIVAVGGKAEAIAIPAYANYVSNPGGWLAMKRFYSFRPLTEPSENIGIRFYYFTSDFNAIANAASLLLNPSRTSLTHQNLYAWKITSINKVYTIDPSTGHSGVPAGGFYNANGYTQYINAASADTVTWKYSSYGNNLHSMEYLVKHSGGGGLGVGSINGRGALQLLTYTFTGNGNWSTIANWASSNKPPAILPSNGRVVISPAGTGECILDVEQHIPAGGELIINPFKKFRINSNLQVKQ